jgi:endogenous inhibitor of DNA gyrase (YacG/DUF329 family)
MNESTPTNPTETYTRTCPYCGATVPIERNAQLGDPCGMSQPATDCPECGYTALPRLLWPSDWK